MHGYLAELRVLADLGQLPGRGHEVPALSLAFLAEAVRARRPDREDHRLAAPHEPLALLRLHRHLAVEHHEHLLGAVVEVVGNEIAGPQLVNGRAESVGPWQPLGAATAARPVLALVPLVRPDVVVAHARDSGASVVAQLLVAQP